MGLLRIATLAAVAAMVSPRGLYFAEDETTVVEEGDERASFLAVAAGCETTDPRVVAFLKGEEPDAPDAAQEAPSVDLPTLAGAAGYDLVPKGEHAQAKGDLMAAIRVRDVNASDLREAQAAQSRAEAALTAANAARDTAKAAQKKAEGDATKAKADAQALATEIEAVKAQLLAATTKAETPAAPPAEG